MKAKMTILIILLALVAGLGSQALFVINEYDQAIVMQFGAHVKTVREPGLHFKVPFIQNVFRFDKRVLMADGQPAEYLTRDRKRLIVDHIARWRIVDPLLFYQTVRTEYGALSRLNDNVVSLLRQQVSSHDFQDMIRSEREVIMEAVTRAAIPAAAQFGIEIMDVRIKRADLPVEVEQSVFERMQAERQAIAAGYRAEGDQRAQEIRADAERERDIILAEAYEAAQRLRGEGEALAMQIFADAYNRDPEFFTFMRSLEVYEKILKEQTTLVLPSNSPLFRYLESPQ